mmetsp:Transcript_37550/g.98621  ORF Transcript_37550/g.98621 Transcript_37550/m.98621 type:complete len:137 (-) Transcript_37550:1721-2131(-)
MPPQVLAWALRTAVSQLENRTGAWGAPSTTPPPSSEGELLERMRQMGSSMEALAAEVASLRKSNRGGKGGKAAGGGDGGASSEEEGAEERKLRSRYLEIRDELVSCLSRGVPVPEGLHAAREVHLHQLQDDELQQE